MSFKFSTNFLLPYVRKPAKYGGRGCTGLDATPTVQINICHPVVTNVQTLSGHAVGAIHLAPFGITKWTTLTQNGWVL